MLVFSLRLPLRESLRSHFGLRVEGVRTAAVMPSQSQWLRARAIHSFFKSSDNVDCSIHQLVFKFCDCPPQIFSGKNSRAFSLLTDWGSVVTWGDADSGGDSLDVAEQVSSGTKGSPHAITIAVASCARDSQFLEEQRQCRLLHTPIGLQVLRLPASNFLCQKWQRFLSVDRLGLGGDVGQGGMRRRLE